jgi:hypothetical protein
MFRVFLCYLYSFQQNSLLLAIPYQKKYVEITLDH